jgi:hypothetical protein
MKGDGVDLAELEAAAELDRLHPAPELLDAAFDMPSGIAAAS